MSGEKESMVSRAESFSRLRVFSSHVTESRARRPTDLVLAIICAIGLALTALSAGGTNAAGDQLEILLGSLPGLFDWVWALGYDALVAWALLSMGLALFAKGRLGLLRDEAFALVLATALAGWVGSLQGAGWSELLAGFDGTPPAVFPSVRVAVAVAVIATASPHLGMPIRHAGRWVVVLGAISSVMLGVASPVGALAGLCIGFGAAALVHLLFGSPGGRPTFEQIRDSLAELGIETTTITDSQFAARGVVIVEATTTDGRPMVVKVHGRDAWDGQLVAVAFSRIWYRGDAPDMSFNLRSLVEHEAFLTMFADRAGVPIRPVLAGGMSTGGDAIFAAEAAGASFAGLSAADITDATLEAAWASVEMMHEAGIAHARVSARCLSLRSDGVVLLGDFAAASVNARSEQMQTDEAQLLVATSLRTEPARAVAAAVRVLGTDRVAGLLPLLQPAVVPLEDRAAAGERKEFFEELRSTAASAVDVSVPRLAPLRRFTLSWIVKVTLLIALAYVLMTGITGVDLASVSSAIASAAQGWIWVALLVGVAATMAQALSTMGASVVPLSFPPSFALQLAIQFTALFVPSSAARVALCVRFFQKMGQSITAATAVGVVDSVAGFAVQAFLLVALLLSGLASLSLHVQASGSTEPTAESSNGVLVAFLLVILAVLGVVAAVKAKRARAFIRDKWSELGGVVGNLRSFRKLFELLAGNLVGQILLAVALGMCLRAFGAHASMADLILVNTCVSLFAGLMPVPGGIGVTEAALATGLVAIGISEDIAISTAIVYRLVTFYLPPAWGWFGLRWLRVSDRV